MVTEAVIAKREQIADEVAKNRLEENSANNGSNIHLNTGMLKFVFSMKIKTRIFILCMRDKNDNNDNRVWKRVLGHDL